MQTVRRARRFSHRGALDPALEPRRGEVLGRTRGVSGRVVVAAGLRGDLDEGERIQRRADEARGDLGSVDHRFDHGRSAERQRRHHGRRDVRLAFDEPDAERGSTPRRLHHAGQPDPLDRPAERGAPAQVAKGPSLDRHPIRRGDPGAPERVLREQLVEGDLALERGGSGVRQTEQVQQPLHGSVLALLPVQREVADIRRPFPERFDERTLSRIEDPGVVPEFTE